MVQVRHSSSQIHPWLLPFLQRGDAGTFSSCVPCCSPSGYTSLTSLFLPSLSKTTPSPGTFSSTSISRGQNIPWHAVHGPWKSKLDRGPVFNSLSRQECTLRSAPLAIMHQLCGHFQGVLGAIGGVLPYGLPSSFFLLFCTFLSLTPFPFFICHPLKLLGFLFL